MTMKIMTVIHPKIKYSVVSVKSVRKLYGALDANALFTRDSSP